MRLGNIIWSVDLGKVVVVLAVGGKDCDCMLSRSFDDIAGVVMGKKRVYSLDVDARIREVANRLSAKAFIELLAQVDDRDGSLEEALLEMCRDLPEGGTYVIGFAENVSESDADEGVPQEPLAGAEFYLRLVFRNEDAAYYQYPLFPNLSRDYIVSAARKRAGDAQYVRLELTAGRFLQTFIEECRGNPHFLRVEECTEKDFWAAPSNAV